MSNGKNRKEGNQIYESKKRSVSVLQFLRLLLRIFNLKLNSKKSRRQVLALQRKKLNKLLLFAYDHSSYYRRIFEEKGITRKSIKDRPLSDFPSIDKEILMESFEELITVPDVTQKDLRLFDENPSEDGNIFKGKYHIVHSSGSTGIPRYFLYDEDAWNWMLPGILRAATWDMSMLDILKTLKEGIRILYIAAVNGRYGGAMAVGDGIDGLKGSRLFLDVNTPLEEWKDLIETFRPNILVGYPSALKILAESCERGEVSVDVIRVVSCGEPLGSGIRSFFEKLFGSVVINLYGAGESLALGVETKEGEGLSLFDDLNLIEVCDNEMYLTSLYNFSQPLIRYRISDRLVLRKEPGRADEPFLKADVLLCRNEDVLWFEDKNGKRDFIHPLSVEGFCVDGLIDFQFSSTGNDSFEMLAEVSGKERRSSVEIEVKKLVEDLLREKNLEFVRFSVRFTDEILPDPRTGKKALIVNTGNTNPEKSYSEKLKSVKIQETKQNKENSNNEEKRRA